LDDLTKKVLDELQRATEQFIDDLDLGNDRLVRDLGLESLFSSLLLTDEEREAIEARAFSRTLADIDELEEHGHR
jgi:hypothetical protein